MSLITVFNWFFLKTLPHHQAAAIFAPDNYSDNGNDRHLCIHPDSVASLAACVQQ